MSDPTSLPALNSPDKSIRAFREESQGTLAPSQEVPRANSHPLLSSEGAVGTRMRMRTAQAHASHPVHAQKLQPLGHRGLREASPPCPAPAGLGALLRAGSSSLPFPAGRCLAPAFLYLCSRSWRDPCHAPWPGLRGGGAGRPSRSALPVRSKRSGGERWEVVLGMEPSWVGAAPQGPWDTQ